MPDAFVNVTVSEDSTVPVEELADLDGVDAAHEVRCEYDAVVELELPDPQDLQEVVTGSIQNIPGVTGTVTLVSPELAEQHRPTDGVARRVRGRRA